MSRPVEGRQASAADIPVRVCALRQEEGSEMGELIEPISKIRTDFMMN